MLRIISIARWSEMQHYKHRNPPWIKLHAELLDRPEFRALSSCDVGTYCKLLLIAARNGNRITYDARWLRRRYGLSSIAIRNLERCGLITVVEREADDSRSELDRHPNGGRSATDPNSIGTRSVTDPSPIGAHSDTDRSSIENTPDTQLQTNQASKSSSASTALAHRLPDADSEGEGETETEAEAEAEAERTQQRDASLRRDGNGAGRNPLIEIAKDALPGMKTPPLRVALKNGDYERINDAVEKVIKAGIARDDIDNIARIAQITPTQARKSVQQLINRRRIR